MKKNGIVHAELASALTALRHTDLFAVADSGLPVPVGVPVIDLGVGYGVPEFLPVLDLILAEVETEGAWGSADIDDANPVMLDELRRRLEVDLIAHDELKSRIGQCRFVVRTGEATPYANVLLQAGVPWL